MKNYDKLSDNEHKIDLISLNEFLLEKGDSFLNRIIETQTIKREEITKEFFQDRYVWIFKGIKDRSDFNGEDFPSEWYTEGIINGIIRRFVDYTEYGRISEHKFLLCLNSKIQNYYSLCEKAVDDNPFNIVLVAERAIDYSLCEKAVNGYPNVIISIIPEKFKTYSLWELAISKNGYLLKEIPKNLIDYSLCEKAIKNDVEALQFVPKNIENYYDLVKLTFEKSSYIVEADWFPKEYILKLINDEDYPSRKEYLTKQYYLKENNNMTKKDLLIEFIKKEIARVLTEAKKSKKKVGPTGKKLIKRKDGSYSEEGLYDNIRKNKGSGKKPTAQMKAQEKKIKKAEK
jgi:hypothetical protein